MTTSAGLDALIEALTVDAYNDEEQLAGFLDCSRAGPRCQDFWRIVGTP